MCELLTLYPILVVLLFVLYVIYEQIPTSTNNITQSTTVYNKNVYFLEVEGRGNNYFYTHLKMTQTAVRLV